ncbi:hypothetical protein COCOBI_08-3740 [Coccomyxa sp. Obi]|nr:hypothetical protein COCOBI_08-3740 [Coccomyxa sp. Obi]
MLRKKKTEGKLRRARLDIVDGEDHEDSSLDPITAALEERQRKQEEALKAAAAAAAKRASATLTTYFADDDEPTPSPVNTKGPPYIPSPAGSIPDPALVNGVQSASVSSSKAADQMAVDHSLAAAQPSHLQPSLQAIDVPAAVSEAADEQGNPLASLLGYSYDDGSGSEAGDEETHEAAAEADAPASEDGDSSMDAELANFMEELESSGLLKEGAPADQPLLNAAAEETLAAAPVEAPSTSAPEDLPANTIARDEVTATEGAAETSGAAQAEQRVLGSLEGCPGWHEVMDMGSGRVYFWCEDTDEVAWDPPEGSVPRSKQQNDATFAAAHAVPGTEMGSVELCGMESSVGVQETAAHITDAVLATAAVEEPPVEGKAVQDQTQEVPQGGVSASPEDPGQKLNQPSTASDQEEGEIGVRAAAIDRPSDEVEKAGKELLESAWEAAERICGPVPLLVRLAVEVEVRLREWRAFSEAQQRAAEAGDGTGALSWASYQRSVQESWSTLKAALPMALQEAESASAAVAAAVADASAAAALASQAPDMEDGELPENSDAGPSTVITAAQPTEPPVPDIPPLPTEPESLPPPLPASEDHDIDMDVEESPPALPPQATAEPQKAQPASSVGAVVSDELARINSRIAAASVAGVQHLPQPVMMVPLPAPAPQWPGYYAPYVPYMHYPPYYAQQPLAYPAPVTSTATAAPVSLPAPAHTTTTEHLSTPPLPTDSVAQPPLPDDQPASVQLPAPSGGQVSSPAAEAQLTRAREYRAEPVRAVTPPSTTVSEGGATTSSGEAGGLQVPVVGEEKKRKAEKAAVGTGPLAKKKKALRAGKATSSLIDKWAAVRKDLVDEEEVEEVPDADALERRRLREAEEWRLKQLRAGVSSEDNSNFQPLALDWREKMKTAKAAATVKRKPAATTPAPVIYSERPDLEALSVGLPAGWKALWDKTSKEVYYANPKTKETSWEKPT